MHADAKRRVLVTGGMGFIGSAAIRHMVGERGWTVLNVDKLTYSGNEAAVAAVAESPLYEHSLTDVCDGPALAALFTRFRPDAVMHLAAETHVDRSIDGPAAFIQTNVNGTFTLLEAALDYWRTLPEEERKAFRFLHISTDEVFGSLPLEGGERFKETTAFAPNSPYAASKAGSDHLVRAWYHTYGLPTLISNCSNNYGPYQFPEKLIPVMVLNALEGRPLPVYGDGLNVRDWLYVDDHVRALTTILERGEVGSCYTVGGDSETRNIDLVTSICEILDDLLPRSSHRPHAALITKVADRPGHDLRYAVDAGRLRRELGWAPRETLVTGLRRTVTWYLENESWWRSMPGYARLGLGRESVASHGDAGKGD